MERCDPVRDEKPVEVGVEARGEEDRQKLDEHGHHEAPNYFKGLGARPFEKDIPTKQVIYLMHNINFELAFKRKIRLRFMD